MKWTMLIVNLFSLAAIAFFWSNTKLFQVVKWYWPGYVTEQTYTRDEVIELMGSMVNTAMQHAYRNYTLVLIVLTVVIVLNAILNIIDFIVSMRKRRANVSLNTVLS